MTNTDVVKKLIGPIRPIGESHTDAQRMENLKAMCDLVDGLLDEINDVAQLRFNHEHSVKEAAMHAQSFLNRIVQSF